MGRERTVNRLSVDKVRNAIVQKRSQRSTAICLDRGFASRGGSTESLALPIPAARENLVVGRRSAEPRPFDSPRDVALREEAKAFALQNRCGAL